MKVLITGGSGMLGRALVARLLAKKHEVVGVSKSGRFGGIACDLSRSDEVERLFSGDPFDCVIHTAAYSDVDGCERDPRQAYEANAAATDHLVRACQRQGSAMVHVSTDYVFSGDGKKTYFEDDAVCPVNVYGMTKLMAEQFVLRSRLRAAIVRTSWLFGSGNPSTFVNAVIRRLRTEPLVRVLDDQVDSPTHVDDLSEALERIAVRLAGQDQGRSVEVFQVCNTGSTTRLEMTRKLKEYLGLEKVRVERMDAAELKGRLAIRPAYMVMSTAAYENTFGVRLRPWQEALHDYVASGDCDR